MRIFQDIRGGQSATAICQRKTFHQVALTTRRNTAGFLVAEVGGVHHQGLAFPVADRMPLLGALGPRRVCLAIGIDRAARPQSLRGNQDVIGGFSECSDHRIHHKHRRRHRHTLSLAGILRREMGTHGTGFFIQRPVTQGANEVVNDSAVATQEPEIAVAVIVSAGRRRRAVTSGTTLPSALTIDFVAVSRLIRKAPAGADQGADLLAHVQRVLAEPADTQDVRRRRFNLQADGAALVMSRGQG